MPARGRASFNKRQKEQQRKERNQEKIARRQNRKGSLPATADGFSDAEADGNLTGDSETTGLPDNPLHDAQTGISQ
jgi:hypothetical protein